MADHVFELIRFDSYSECPHCLSKDFNLYYCIQGHDEKFCCSYPDSEVEAHIHWTCNRCKFEWFTHTAENLSDDSKDAIRGV